MADSFPLRLSRSIWLGTLLAALLVCCHQKQKKAEYPRQPSPHLTAKPQRPPEGIDPFRNSTVDLLPVQGDTLIALKHYGLALTTDAGQQWQDIATRMPSMVQLAIDHHHTLWGLDWSPGTHRGDPYSRLSYSTDFGKSWVEAQDFDPQTFFPVAFFSQPGHPIQVVTEDGKLFQLTDRLGKAWSFVRSIAGIDTRQDTLAAASYFENGRFKALKTGQLFARTAKGWQPVATVKMLKELHGVCSCQGRIYVTGRKQSGATPLYVLQIANGRVQDSIQTTEDYLALRCDAQSRLWLFGTRGIWQKGRHMLFKRY